MPDFLANALNTQPVEPLDILLRLLVAAILGLAVAWIYRRTRPGIDLTASFPTTLVLLATLIAMVTQVIGDNIARAFSLVGALSIVRFRTVVRDTEDTAYVIFAVAVGMAVGASDLWVAALGLGVVGGTAFFLNLQPARPPTSQASFLLNLRVPLGLDLDQFLTPALAPHVTRSHLVSVETARQGLALELSYEVLLQPSTTPDRLVLALNRLEGVQSVQAHRQTPQPE